MNENEFQFNGKTYIAVDGKAGFPGYVLCRRCAFLKEFCYKLVRSEKIPACLASYRKDNRDVYFVEKGAQK